MLRLQIIEDGVAPRLVTFNREAIVIGRTDACDLQLTGKGVSSQHCKITRIPGGYRLEDLGSTNGTYVNRKRVGPPQTVTGYDEIVMAVYQLKLLEEIVTGRPQTGAMPVASAGAAVYPELGQPALPSGGYSSSGPQSNGAQSNGQHSNGPRSQPPPATHPMLPAVMTPSGTPATAGPSSAIIKLPPSGHFDDAAWVREWQRIDKLAADWFAARRDSARLLRGDKLTHARNWLSQSRSRQPPPKREHKDFILASTRASQLRILRNVTFGGLVLGAAAVAAVVVIRKEERTVLNGGLAGMQAKPKGEGGDPGEPDKVDSSKSDALAAKAEALLDTQPVVAAWIAIEALQRLPPQRELDSRGSRAERVLRRALAGMRGRPLPGHDGEIAAMAMSDDGRWVASAASGSESSAVRLWQLDRGSTAPQMLRAHVGAVRQLVFSSDGTRLVSAGEEDKLYVWDLSDPESEPVGRAFGGAPSGTSALAMSRDGKSLLAGGRDGSVKLFDLAGGGGVALGAHAGPVNAVALAPDGTRALSVADDGFALTWRLSGSVPTGKPVQLEGHMGAVLDGALSPDGRWAVTGGADGFGMLWDLHSARPSTSVRQLSAHEGSKVTRVAVTPDSRFAITGSADHRLAVWKLFVASPEVSAAKDPRATGEITELLVRGPSATDADRAGRSQVAYSTSADGHVRSLELAKMDTELAGNDSPVFDGPITAFALDARGLVFAAGARDGSARIDDIDEKSGAGLALVGRGHASQVLDVAIASGGTRVLTGGADGTAKLWDATRPGRLHELHTFAGHKGRVDAVAVAPNGRIAVTGDEAGVLRMWDLSAADPVAASREFPGHTGKIHDLVFGPDGSVLISVSADKSARVWKMKQKDPGAGVVVLAHDDEVTEVAIGPDARWLMTASIGQLNLWDLQLENPASATKALAEHESDIMSVAMSPKGRWAASADTLGKVILWDLQGAKVKPLRLRKHEDKVVALAFDPTGEWLATGGGDKLVVVWRVSSKNPDEHPIELPGHDKGITVLGWSSDGKWLLSGSNDSTVRAWPVTAADPVAAVMVLDGHDELVSGLAVESSQYVVTSSYDKSVRVWPLQPAEMVSAACVRLGQGLGDQQWVEHIGGDVHDPCVVTR